MVGKVAAGEKRRGRPRKKRKGRPPGAVTPSGRQQQPPSPPPPPASRRSLRQRRPRRVEDFADYDDDGEEYYFDEMLVVGAGEEEDVADDEEEEEDAEWKRREKKFKLLQKLPNHGQQQQHHHHHESAAAAGGAKLDDGGIGTRNRGGSAGSANCSSSSEEVEGGGGAGPPGKWKTRGHGGGSKEMGCEDGVTPRSDGSGGGNKEVEDGRGHASPRCCGSASGNVFRDCPNSTPLPDKKTLEAILDKLQKKDTYGVYADPVDPEELPDYHEIIEHPMDFGTIRRKLSTGVYANLEEIEGDVFLVCANAMEYNAPDTIYFRQARSIQELARKKFQSIRSERGNALKSEPISQSSSMAKKSIKGSISKAAHDPAGDPGSSAATLSSAGDDCTGLNAVQAGPEQPLIIEHLVDGNLTCENKSDAGDNSGDILAKSSPVKLTKKPIVLDEDRRASYNVLNEQHESPSDSLFATFDSEPKHLIAVGLGAEYSYARSLARFASSLGPIAWKVASEKIEKSLPQGVKFGPGWVGEYEPLPTPILFFERHLQQQSGLHAHFKHKAENWKHGAMEDERKGTRPAANETIQLYSRTSSDSSTTVVIDEKANHLKGLSAYSGHLEQSPRLFGFNARCKPTASNVTFVPHNSLDVTSAKGYSNAKVGNDISDKTLQNSSSSMMGTAGIVARRPEDCPEITTSGLQVSVRGGKHNMQSERFKQPEMVAYRPKSSSLCMETRGLFNGKDTESLVSNNKLSTSLSFIPINQMRPGSNCFNHDGLVQNVDDHSPLMGTSGRIPMNASELVIADDRKQVMPTVPSPRSNSSSAATAAARAWMSVGRSSEHKSTDSSSILKTRGAASLGMLTSESPASASRIHEVDKLRSSVSQLPCRTTAEELLVQNRSVTTFPQFIVTELSRFHGQTPWRGLAPHVQHKQKKDVCPPDLNISFQSPGSPVLQTSFLVDPQQPDLALQL